MSSRLRALGIGLIVCALVVAAAGSVGFSTMSADRNVNVAVTDDASALISYDSPDRIVVENRGNRANVTDSTPAANHANGTDSTPAANHANGTDSTPAANHANGTDSIPANINTERTLVEVTNRLHTSIDVVDVDIDASDGIDVEIQQLPRNVGVGESGEIRATISCMEPVGMADISVTVQIEGEHVAASIFGDTETRSIPVTCE